MSSPFRSELAQLQEQLRRAEERSAALEAEHEALERRAMRGQKPYGWLIVVLAGACVSGCLGYAAASVPATKRQAEAQAKHAADGAELAMKNEELAKCAVTAKARRLEGDACVEQRAAMEVKLKLLGALDDARRHPPLPDVPRRGATWRECQPGDPLCSPR